MDNNFVKDMEILFNCKRLVEDLVKEKEYILERLTERGCDVRQAYAIQKQIDRYKAVLNGERYGR